MDKKEQKRQEIIEKTSHYLLENGLLSVSLRPLAKALRTSDRMLLHYFSSKEELLTESLTYLAKQFVVEISQYKVGKLPQNKLLQVMGELIYSGMMNQYMRLWLEILLSSLNQESSYSYLGADFFDIYYMWIEEHLILEDGVVKEKQISQTLALIEGMILFHIAKKDIYVDQITES